MTALVARDVCVRFGGVTALDRFSVELHPGEKVALIGPNGSGKTTALNAMTGFVRLSSGSVELGGAPRAGHRSPEAIAAAGVRRTFQRPRLLDDHTVTENIALGAFGRAPRELTADVLGQLGLAGLSDRRAGSLSHGQRRMVEVLRVWVAQPRYLLLDEPAGGLNQEEQEQLVAFLDAAVQDHGVGVLLVEHSVPLVRSFADRLVVLDHGEVIFSGAAADGFASEVVRQAYFGGSGSERVA